MISARLGFGASMLVLVGAFAIAAAPSSENGNAVSDDEARLIVGGGCGTASKLVCSNDPDGTKCGSVAGLKSFNSMDNCTKLSSKPEDTHICGTSAECGTYTDKTEACAK